MGYSKVIGQKSRGKVPFSGVYFNITRQRYRARVTRKDVVHVIGYYDTAIEASDAREKFIKDLIHQETHHKPKSMNLIVNESKYGPKKSRF